MNIELPSGRRAPVFEIKLPPPSHAAQVIDAVLQDPELASELRGRVGPIGKKDFNGKGRMTVAPRDGHCMKPLGWRFSDNGRLESVECGEPIQRGERVWQQDGFSFYGIGCHPKGGFRLGRKFIERELIGSRDICEGPEERDIALKVAQAMWAIELEVGNMKGAFGSYEAEQSRNRIESAMRQALIDRKKGGWKDKSIPKHYTPPKSQDVIVRKRGISVADPQPERQTMVSAPPVTSKREVKRFTGNEKKAAYPFARIINNARALTKDQPPLVVIDQGDHCVVVEDPSGSYE